MSEARMDGVAYEVALFRIEALREALIDARNTTSIVAARRFAENALTSDDTRAQQQRSKEADEASYADLRASGGIFGAPYAPALHDALASCAAWLERWGQHADACHGDARCTCGLVAMRYEANAALATAVPTISATDPALQDKAAPSD